MMIFIKLSSFIVIVLHRHNHCHNRNPAFWDHMLKSKFCEHVLTPASHHPLDKDAFKTYPFDTVGSFEQAGGNDGFY